MPAVRTIGASRASRIEGCLRREQRTREVRERSMADKNFTLDVDGDGIALVRWDMAGRSMNVIDLTVIDELSAIVDQVADDAGIKGAVITSGKDTFSGGADLAM